MTARLKITAAVVMLLVTGAIGFSATTLLAHKATPQDTSHIVKLQSDRAEPSAIAITRGDYVQFNSADGRTHNIGQGRGDDQVHVAAGLDEHDHAGDGKESGDFGPDEGYRVQFNQVGTYDFHDHLNPTISVTVIVYEAKK